MCVCVVVLSVYMCVYACAFKWACVHAFMCRGVALCDCLQQHTHTHIHTHAHTHTHMRAHANTHTHIHISLMQGEQAWLCNLNAIHCALSSWPTHILPAIALHSHKHLNYARFLNFHSCFLFIAPCFVSSLFLTQWLCLLACTPPASCTPTNKPLLIPSNKPLL
jgi:hypothetical protein